MSPKIFLIHGFNSSHHSFAHLSSVLKIDTVVNYNSHQRLSESLLEVSEQLPVEPIILIGHSLGGVIATLLALSGTLDVKGVCTIGSPLGGSQGASYAKYLFGTKLPVLHDISPSSTPIRILAEHEPPCPVLSIISTAGHLPTSSEKNDSVVTLQSQRALSYAKKIEVKANHFEVLNHPDTLIAVKEFLK